MKLVKSKFSKWHWLVDDNGKRITKKFVKHLDYEYGPIKCLMMAYKNDSQIGYLVITPDRYFYSEERPFINDVNKKYYSVSTGVDDKQINLTYNKEGKLIGDDMYIYLYLEQEGMCAVQINDKSGFTDENLNWIIEPKFLSIKTFFLHNRAIVEIDKDKCVIIDKKGNYIGEPFECHETAYIPDIEMLFKVGIITSKSTNGYSSKDEDLSEYWGIMDLDGNVIIPTKYHEIEKTGNYYVLKRNGKYGLADSEGKTILECIYPEIVELDDKFVVSEMKVVEKQK